MSTAGVRSRRCYKVGVVPPTCDGSAHTRKCKLLKRSWNLLARFVRLNGSRMKALWLSAILMAAPFAGCGVPGEEEKALEELNVNSRYTVESVQVMGLRSVKISESLRHEIDGVIGAKLDHPALEKLANRIKAELHVPAVAIKVNRGTEPDHVIVNFEVSGVRDHDLDLKVTKFGRGTVEKPGTPIRRRPLEGPQFSRARPGW